MWNKEDAIDALKTNYRKIGHPIAFSNVNTIFNYFDKTIPIDEIKDFLSTITTYQVHRENRRSARSYIPVFAIQPRQLVEIDLCDMQYFSPPQNDNTRHLLIGKSPLDRK